MEEGTGDSEESRKRGEGGVRVAPSLEVWWKRAFWDRGTVSKLGYDSSGWGNPSEKSNTAPEPG